MSLKRSGLRRIQRIACSSLRQRCNVMARMQFDGQQVQGQAPNKRLPPCHFYGRLINLARNPPRKKHS